MGGESEAEKAAKRQRKQMQEEQQRADAERNKVDQENQQAKDANRRRRLGRASLITTSELGVDDDLG